MSLLIELIKIKSQTAGVVESTDDADFSDLLQTFMDQNDITNLEGSGGVKALGKICSALGYGAAYNSSLNNIQDFFEDNSDAITAVVEWIIDQGERNSDWADSIRDKIGSAEGTDDDN